MKRSNAGNGNNTSILKRADMRISTIVVMLIFTVFSISSLQTDEPASAESLKEGYEVEIQGSSRNITAPKESEEMCKTISISEDAVRYYFAHSTRISLDKSVRKFEWPACHFYGRIRENGNILTWKIWTNGLGIIERDYKPIEILYCAQCAGRFGRTQ